LGSSGQPKKNLADEALESFGVTTPLLRFHGVHSRCYSPEKSSHEVADEESYLEEEEEAARTDPDDNDNVSTLAEIMTLERTNGKSVLKYHPYIITR
jgi:hypothetical protein